jgi:hypothetical protein
MKCRGLEDPVCKRIVPFDRYVAVMTRLFDPFVVLLESLEKVTEILLMLLEAGQISNPIG